MESSARVTEHRLPPMITPVPPRGFCRWCGGAITSKGRDDRAWHKGRDGERNCQREYVLTSANRYQRQAVFDRDGGKCHDCGKVCEPGVKVDPNCQRDGGSERTSSIYVHEVDLAFFRSIACDIGWLGYLLAAGPYCPVAFVATHTWEVDHDFPLWLVDRTKPREEIIKYWMLGNLVTRCISCHKLKSKAETAQRAKGRRIAARAAAVKNPKKPGRKIQSRGFDKRYTQKLRTRELVPRRAR